ncbi:hypothetical protein GCM10011504_20500 [Siccirubricoccus deserti]|nr:hypothetical protein GCM10011504_20500 [Siccirubricoccus deserti]
MHLAAQPEAKLPAGILVHDHLAVTRQVALHSLAEYKVTRHWMRPAQRIARPAAAMAAQARPGG